MNTVKCSNRLCEKEYNVQFDNCPFCGTPNPMEKSKRKVLAEKNMAGEKPNDEDVRPQFNVIIIGLIWISILFFGIRGIITSFANMMFSPWIGCLTLFLSIIGMISLFFILRAKKWALFLWIAYRLAAGIVNGLINTKFDFATNIVIAIANIGLMVLVLQIKKNGISAWSLIFKRHKTTIEYNDNINDKLIENIDSAYNGNSSIANRIEKNTVEIPRVKEEDIIVQKNQTTDAFQETLAILETENNQTEFPNCSISAESQSDVKEAIKSDGKPNVANTNEYSNSQTKIDKKKTALWCTIVILVAVLGVGIWTLVHKDNTRSDSITNKVESNSMETFDCGLFSLEYPKIFKKSPIQNAPHMVLKLESEEYFISASYWDYGISDDVSIWDDEIFEQYKQIPIEGGELVDISKESIKTKCGMKHCLRIKANVNKHYNGTVIQLRMLSYLMIQNGYLFNFTFESEGKYSKTSSTVYPNNIMSGLCLKSNKENPYAELFNNVTSGDNESVSSYNINQRVHDEMNSIVQSNNDDLPEYLGFGMTMIKCVLEQHSMVYVIQWRGMNPSDFSSEDVAELKDAMVEGLKEEKQESPGSKAMLNTMNTYGYNFVYRYVNESGQYLCSISISPSEI